jgi:hypothetical protein
MTDREAFIKLSVYAFKPNERHNKSEDEKVCAGMEFHASFSPYFNGYTPQEMLNTLKYWESITEPEPHLELF